jgi:hypothetical protein
MELKQRLWAGTIPPLNEKKWRTNMLARALAIISCQHFSASSATFVISTSETQSQLPRLINGNLPVSEEPTLTHSGARGRLR